MLKLTLAIGGDSLSVDGDLDLPAVLPVIHDWYAARPQTVSDEWAARVTQTLDAILTLTQGGSTAAEQGFLMATVADLQTRVATMQADVTAGVTVEASVETLLTAQTALIADIRAQLAAAGTDPAALQGVVDALDAITSSNEATMAKTTAAVVANTPAAP